MRFFFLQRRVSRFFSLQRRVSRLFLFRRRYVRHHFRRNTQMRPRLFNEHATLPFFRYKLDRELLLSTKEEDKCFCRKKGHRRVCPRKGLVDISVCTNGSPLIMSLPHFWEADKSLLQQIDGLHPRAENHESYLDLYPVSRREMLLLLQC